MKGLRAMPVYRASNYLNLIAKEVSLSILISCKTEERMGVRT